MARTAVVALGGNALIRQGQSGTHEEQLANAREMAAASPPSGAAAGGS